VIAYNLFIGFKRLSCKKEWRQTIEPFKKRQNRQVIGKAPKFYFFDVGVAGAVTRRWIMEERGEPFGRAFKHLIFMELSAHS